MRKLESISDVPTTEYILLYSTETDSFAVGKRDGDSFLIGTLRYSPDLFTHYDILVKP